MASFAYFPSLESRPSETSSSQAAYRSARRKRQASFTPLLVLSPRKAFRLPRGPREASYLPPGEGKKTRRPVRTAWSNILHSKGLVFGIDNLAPIQVAPHPTGQGPWGPRTGLKSPEVNSADFKVSPGAKRLTAQKRRAGAGRDYPTALTQ